MTTEPAEVKVTVTASTEDFSRIVSEAGPELLGPYPGGTIVPLDRDAEG